MSVASRWCSVQLQVGLAILLVCEFIGECGWRWDVVVVLRVHVCDTCIASRCCCLSWRPVGLTEFTTPFASVRCECGVNVSCEWSCGCSARIAVAHSSTCRSSLTLQAEELGVTKENVCASLLRCRKTLRMRYTWTELADEALLNISLLAAAMCGWLKAKTKRIASARLWQWTVANCRLHMAFANFHDDVSHGSSSNDQK